MPEAWSDKDERQYEHIKDSARERGKSMRRAKEIAARTVNKQRQEEGRTEQKVSSGTGNPHTSYEERTKRELLNLAKEHDISGSSSMTKPELIRALRRQRSH